MSLKSQSIVKSKRPTNSVHYLTSEASILRRAQIFDEHKRETQAFFQARLAHLFILGHDLQTGNGVTKYIHIGGSQMDLKLYPNATPIYKVVGVTLYNIKLHFGPKWINLFRSKCVTGFRIREMSKVSFFAVPDGNSSISPEHSYVKELGQSNHHCNQSCKGVWQ